MRFTRYPQGEPYQITSRKLAAIAIEREQWWQQMILAVQKHGNYFSFVWAARF
jgi:hypothetical protein